MQKRYLYSNKTKIFTSHLVILRNKKKTSTLKNKLEIEYYSKQSKSLRFFDLQHPKQECYEVLHNYSAFLILREIKVYKLSFQKKQNTLTRYFPILNE